MRDKLKRAAKRLSRDERTKIARVLSSVPRGARVIEMGCGFGKKLRLLKSLGFTNLTGVEKNSEVARAAAKSGLNVKSLEEFEHNKKSGFDLLVLSHVIEHFAVPDLLAFMESSLELVGPGGKCLIVSPVLTPHFFLDLDHVKPYYPQGIKTFFGKGGDQVSAYAPHILRLEDLYFRRSPFKIKLSRALLLKRNDFFPLLANLGLALAFAASFGLVGRTTGWIGLYEVRKR